MKAKQEEADRLLNESMRAQQTASPQRESQSPQQGQHVQNSVQGE